MKTLGLYIHIPFCIKKCKYCDFYSVISNDSTQALYINAVKEQLKQLRELELLPIDTIFIGGGTPSLLSSRSIRDLFEELIKFDITQDCEISMEINPGTVDKEKVKTIRSVGINRISMGVQSLCDDELKTLGRIHKSKQVFKAFDLLRKADFDNINLDLLFAIPNQTMGSLKKTIDRMISLSPEHISAYPLKIEDGTEFGMMKKNGTLTEFDEEIDRDMYHYLIKELDKNIYEHYEISNFAKKGYRSKHNLRYWELSDYIGIGAAAHSYYKGERFRNNDDIYGFISDPFVAFDVTSQDEMDMMKEFMMLGLRKISGIKKETFKDKFSKDVYDLFGSRINDLVKRELLIDDEKSIRLTNKGLDFANMVFIEFI